MKLLLLALAIFVSIASPLSAGEDFSKDPLEGLKVSKTEILKSLDTLKAQGKISEADHKKATSEVNKMSDAQVSTINENAIGMVRNHPDKALEFANGSNLISSEEAKKQIQELSKPKK